jgi:hypothetical protein
LVRTIAMEQGSGAMLQQRGLVVAVLQARKRCALRKRALAMKDFPKASAHSSASRPHPMRQSEKE